METELLTALTRLQETAGTILFLLPAVGAGLIVLKGLWPDHWRF